MKTLYLAHNLFNRKLMREWELKMEDKYNVNFDNPFYDHKRNDIDSIDALEDGSKKQGKYFDKRNTKSFSRAIITEDLKLIRKADGLITQIVSPSIGTSMEIFFAARILRIPVYIITKQYSNHPWIIEHATKVFYSMAEFERFAEKEWGRKK